MEYFSLDKPWHDADVGELLSYLDNSVPRIPGSSPSPPPVLADERPPTLWSPLHQAKGPLSEAEKSRAESPPLFTVTALPPAGATLNLDSGPPPPKRPKSAQPHEGERALSSLGAESAGVGTESLEGAAQSNAAFAPAAEPEASSTSLVSRGFLHKVVTDAGRRVKERLQIPDPPPLKKTVVRFSPYLKYNREFIDLCAEFARSNGELPSRRESYRGVSLGSWIKLMRDNYTPEAPASSKLTLELINAIEQIPHWDWNPNLNGRGSKQKTTAHGGKKTWLRTYFMVLRYAEAYGKCPPCTANFEGAAVGPWCTYQKEAYKGTPSREDLTEEKIALLEAIPGWKWTR